MATRSVPINGEVLRWAMEDAGLSHEDLAARLKVSSEKIQKWVTNLDRPSTGEYRKLAAALDRPASFLLLPTPPPATPINVAFRTLRDPDIEVNERNVERNALRLAQRLQKTVHWVHQKLETPRPEIPRASTQSSPEKVATLLREWLPWSENEQLSKELSPAATNQLIRKRIQEKGLLVLHLSLTEHVVRGFSLPDEYAPTIAINTKDEYPARLYSYVHELAHLTLRNDSLCLTKENRGTERWCNQVAAAFLLPSNVILTEVHARYHGEVTDKSQAATLARFFKVSTSAVAIRLENLELAKPGLYDLVTSGSPKSKPRGGTFDPDKIRHKPRARLQDYGRGYVYPVVEAEELGVLPTVQALDLLKVSRSELEHLKQLVASGVEG